MNSDTPENTTTALENGLVSCHVCSMVSEIKEKKCGRCASSLHSRKPRSIGNTWAFLLTAIALYVPAMLLPVSSVTYVGETVTSTLMGNVVDFLHSDAVPVAIIIFIASIVVPMFKLLGLTYLLVSVQHRSNYNMLQRAKMFRFIEFVGRWSMIDVFVISLLVGLVQMGVLANIKPEPGIVAFAAVVVLTIFAANSFDPRLIWDTQKSHD